ncbi:phosphoribosyl transferase [Clostridium polyendosporum]|uniref:Phosphoribosyl transferase n=1 Tax=Clostridium polyendosporum TaxID=69208 RepID=A0A919VG85_9CLOT|nr:ComF family protein [Clostridium polyendosporum]GIM29160.1 phosphoribosyl transferase [Clostridium polyendosporum]
MVNCLLELIYPHKESCLCCEEDISSFLLCKKCIETISFIKEPYAIEEINDIKVYSAAYYSGIIKKLIIRFKYKNDFYSGEAISSVLLELIKSRELTGDLITYVPISKSSLKKRGFNQCEVISKFISNEINIPYYGVLERVKEVNEQKRLHIEDRKTNMIGVFKVNRDNVIDNKRIILIDDVLTTGATVLSCYKELMKSGAKEVIILTVSKSNI